MKQFLGLVIFCCCIGFSLACLSYDFNLGKNTWATSNSERDYNWADKLIPGIFDQGAVKFKQGLCGVQSKLELEGSCFKIHHPTTFQHDEYKVRVSEIETVFSKKIEALKSGSQTTYHYDAFLDHNLGSYVHEIDSLIESFDEYGVNYWLLEWQNKMLEDEEDESMADMTFYSILVHSPESQVLYEFFTVTQPSNYQDLPFMASEMRATFGGFKENSNYPWLEDSDFYDWTIVPIRVSRSVSNVDENIEWYETVLQADTIYVSEDYEIAELNGDNIKTKIGFALNQGTTVEIGFVERELDYTQDISLEIDDITAFLDIDTDAAIVVETVTEEDSDEDKLAIYNSKYERYTVKDWETDLLMEHDEVVKNEFCGFSRWFDNHYGMQLWEYDGLLDKILTALRKYNKYNYKYRVFKQSYQHTSNDGKDLLDKYGKDNVYSLWIVEPNGQTLHVAGDLLNVKDEFSDTIPTWDPQWCKQECGASAALTGQNGGSKSVKSDNTNVDNQDESNQEENEVAAEEAEEDGDENESDLRVEITNMKNTNHEKNDKWAWIELGMLLGILGIGAFVMYYILMKVDLKEYFNFGRIGDGSNEYTPLMESVA